MVNFLKSVRSIPLWCKTTIVLTLGIALCVWFTIEMALPLDQKYLNEKLHDDTQRSTDSLALLLKNAILTRDTAAADAIIKKYISDRPKVTFLHIDDEHSRFFTEWKKHPISFGEGILKYESPVVVGGQTFGRLSLYIDQRDQLNDIQAHVSAVKRRVALTLFAVLLFISAVVNYTAMRPIKHISDDLYKLIHKAERADAEEIGPDEISRLKSALAFTQKLLDQDQHGVDNSSKTDGDS